MYIEKLEINELLDILDVIYDMDKIIVSKFTKIDEGILVELSTKWEVEGEEILDYDELLLEDFGFTSTYDVVCGAKRRFHRYMYERFDKRYADSYFGKE